VTLKGQGRDLIVFDAHYLENNCRYTLGDNGAPIRNGYLGIKWSRD